MAHAKTDTTNGAPSKDATRNKEATSNKCLTSSNKKLVETRIKLLGEIWRLEKEPEQVQHECCFSCGDSSNKSLASHLFNVL